MSDPRSRLFGSREGFGIELARLFHSGRAPFACVCLWINGKALGNISCAMALYHLMGDLNGLNYLERMDENSLRRLAAMEPSAMDFSLNYLAESEPRQIGRLDPGECFDGWDVRVVGGGYDVLFFAKPWNSTSHGPTLCWATTWVLYQPPVLEFRNYVLDELGMPRP